MFKPISMSRHLFSTDVINLAERVYFKPVVSGTKIGRIGFILYDEIVPKRAENFRVLFAGEKGHRYQGTTFHRIIPQFIV